MTTVNYKGLSDSQLEQTLQAAVTKENELKIQILHLLSEVERRRIYSKNYPSLFEYCIQVLKYSRAAAQRRIDSMRAMKLMPEIEEKIISGDLNLSSIAQAQSFFRQEAKIGKPYSVEQKKEVLIKLENKSTRECIKELIAISPESIPQEKRRELSPDKTELRVVLNKDLIKKLDKIKALMSHKNPTMTDQELIEVMAEALLQKIDPAEKVKRAQIKKEKAIQKVPAPELNQRNAGHQQPRKGASPSRYIPSTVKCEVYMRDKGTCAHPNCSSKKFLEYDHIKPLALGGTTSVENLRLLCRAHNQRAAIDRFGLVKMGMFLNR